MKQIGISLILFFLSYSCFASVPRKPLLEELTSTTCIYCDLSDSVIIAFEKEHGESISVLKWFNDWHSFVGKDPFFHDFPQGANRTFFYGVTGVPALYINGESMINPYEYSLDNIDMFFKRFDTLTSPYAIEVQQSIYEDSLECKVTITLVDDVPLDTSLRIAIVIAERSINFQEDAPDYNASPIHTNVVRATLPDFTPSGAPVLRVPTLKQNETKTFTYRKHIDTAWNKEMLRTTAFIQNVHTGEVVQSESSLLKSESVRQNHSLSAISSVYPNPASGRTTISFPLSEPTVISATLFDIHGNQIENISDNRLNAGTQFLSFDASHLPSGVYYYRLQIGEHAETKSLIVTH